MTEFNPAADSERGFIPPPPIFWDLYAYPSFRIRQDHENKRLYISGTVANRGSLPSLRAVSAAVGITVRIKGVLRTTQRIVRINPGLRRGDIVYTEPETVAPLAYFNEDNGAEYLFEHRVDIYHEATDFTRANNYYSYTWWAIDPRLRDAPESLVFGNMEDLEQSDPAERVERGA